MTRTLLCSFALALAFAWALPVAAAASSSHGDASFSLKVSAPPAAAKARRDTVKVHVQPGAGYHLNKDFPAKASVTAPTGVAVEKAVVKVEEGGADFEIPFTAAESGTKVFTGEIKFAVCSATACEPKRESILFTVEVK